MSNIINVPDKYWFSKHNGMPISDLVVWWKKTPAEQQSVKKQISILFVSELCLTQDGYQTMDILNKLQLHCRDLYLIAIDTTIVFCSDYEKYFDLLPAKYRREYHSILYSLRERHFFMKNGCYEKADPYV